MEQISAAQLKHVKLRIPHLINVARLIQIFYHLLKLSITYVDKLVTKPQALPIKVMLGRALGLLSF